MQHCTEQRKYREQVEKGSAIPVDVVAPKISIIPIMVPSSPNKGAIVAIVPKVVRYLESSTSIEFSSSKIRSFTVTSLLLKFAF